MKFIYGKGYCQEERRQYKGAVFTNLVQSMKVILEASTILRISLHELSLPEQDQSILDQHINVVKNSPNSLSDCEALPDDLVLALKALWSHPATQQTFLSRHHFPLNDSAKYYFDNLDRITQPGYLPTDQDIVHSRIKTTGVVETDFTMDKLPCKLIDVGGQRSERRKWIHCFENVTCIIFVVALSEYDQTLAEDESVNRIQESLQLFDQICNSRWFAHSNIVLFLNKVDLFKEKLSKSPLNDYFPDYAGAEGDYETASKFILQKFLDLNKTPNTKTIYPYFTCAIDIDQVKFIMTSVIDIILNKHIREAGLV